MKFKIKRLSLVSITLLSMLTLSGCETTNPYTGQQQTSDTTKGSMIGAASGFAGGLMLGRGDLGAALIGTAIGAGVGAGIGHHADNEREELRQRLVGTGVQINKVGNSIQLVMASDVTFQTNQSAIRADFYPVLNSVAFVLKKYQQNSITVSGFTDNTGAAAYNQVLSEQRAQSVVAYLSSQGIDQNRLFAQGFGMRNPVASNTTVAGRAMNRRVEITLRPL